MLVGYNTNIPYKDKTYHVQTEDNGKNNPVIVTLLYSKGAILASKKTSYADIVSDHDYEHKVRELMKTQHKIMIKELIAGKYTEEAKVEVKITEKAKEKEKVKVEEKIKGVLKTAAVIDGSEQKEKQELPMKNIQQRDAKAEAMDQLAKSLDDILLNYIMKRAK
ncbi:MAG: hypothetical protein FJ240_01340 [Nitrospira sp.]|nr:hypothetical protein [Nitrospira sp.]